MLAEQLFSLDALGSYDRNFKFATGASLITYLFGSRSFSLRR
jgi:hypothetical protein